MIFVMGYHIGSSLEKASTEARQAWDELSEASKASALDEIKHLLDGCGESPEAVRGVINTIGEFVRVGHQIIDVAVNVGTDPAIQGRLLQIYWQNVVYGFVLTPQAQTVLKQWETLGE